MMVFHVSRETQLVVLIALISTSIKMLLMPCYRSTDFEVHRNWMAITHSLPLKRWYFENTSEWTLDYPPFFAYFEYLLGIVASQFDPEMLKVENLYYSQFPVVAFQRMSVTITDFIFIIFSWKLMIPEGVVSEEKPHFVFNSVSRECVARYCLVIFNVGLILVDHIHFQYNGVLMGFLVATVYFAKRKKHLLLTLTFSILVLMKHLFAPLAPIFAVFLLKEASKLSWLHGLLFLCKLVFIAGVCLIGAFMPFCFHGDGWEQILQIFQRLFPFGRGLVHAYWAPNIWALYCFCDKIAGHVIPKLGFPSAPVVSEGFNSASGLVGDFSMGVFPRVSASHCLLLVFFSTIPSMLVVYKNQSSKVLLRVLVYCSLCSFLFGYHVHEKAIIIPWILLTICAETVLERYSLVLLSTAGTVALLPLIHGKFELLIKFVILLFSIAMHWSILDIQSFPTSFRISIYCCVSALLITVAYSEVHGYLFLRYDGSIFLPFLPLMVVSVVCSVVLSICWVIWLMQMYQLWLT